MIGYSLGTRLVDQVVTQQQKWLWLNKHKRWTLSWKVVEVLPWLTP